MLRRYCSVSLLLGAIFMAGCNKGGDESPQPPPVVAHVSVTHEMSVTAAVPGQSVLILWRFEVDDGWHLYWNGRNDSGFPTAVKLELPEGWQAGPLLWPAPERHLTAGEILDHVYYGQLLLLQELKVSPGFQPGQTVTIPARLDWLVCREECVPGQVKLELEIPVATKAEATSDAAEIAKAVDALPVPAPAGGVGLVWTDSTVEIVVPDAGGLEFYPANDCGLLVDLIKDGAAPDGRLVLRLRASDGRIGPVKGILHQLLRDGSTRNWLIDAHPGG